jgi:hypothetical protein
MSRSFLGLEHARGRRRGSSINGNSGSGGISRLSDERDVDVVEGRRGGRSDGPLLDPDPFEDDRVVLTGEVCGRGVIARLPLRDWRRGKIDQDESRRLLPKAQWPLTLLEPGAPLFIGGGAVPGLLTLGPGTATDMSS